ncbi:unnamed protein product [Diatraea saccharalis]|uniref:Uncharacterized protein n=1 Tax=Diatraea saccharalis TaxID=40085 RepID=A0A9N9RDK9_9NEOP|nr:unnamed protein product [Diatraea saccharalis]
MLVNDMKSLIVLILSVQIVLTVKYEFDEYTRESRTLTGKTCLTGCSPIDNECVVDWQWKNESCRAYEPAPVYMTSRFKDRSSKYCLSNCDYFGSKEQWCITTKDLKWDFCTKYKRPPFTGTKSRSETIITQTVVGETCLGPCHRCECTDYNWCKVENKWKWHYCAYPAMSRIPVLPADYNVGQKLKGICDDFLKFHSSMRRDTHYEDKSSLPDNFLAELADGIEITTGQLDTVAKVVRLNDVNNPIESYVTVNINNIYVPAIVRAHISKDMLHRQTNVSHSRDEIERKVREQMSGNTNPYVIENLIGDNVGGPDKDYNVVPMSQDLSCVWYELWEAIRNWSQDSGGSVDVLVVVFYSDANTPVPKAFGVSLTFRNIDRSLFLSCRETVYFNVL